MVTLRGPWPHKPRAPGCPDQGPSLRRWHQRQGEGVGGGWGLAQVMMLVSGATGPKGEGHLRDLVVGGLNPQIKT